MRFQELTISNYIFIGMHFLPFLAFFTTVTLTDWIVCFALYSLRILSIGIGYHRYFSHKTFQTSRTFQFILAFLAQTTVQKGVLWWASHHRAHHRYSDKKEDPHSPIADSFFYAHIGWLLNNKNGAVNEKIIPDLMKFPELRWLDKYEHVPAVIMAILCFAFGGWSMLLIGFFLSTLLVYHATFSINSITHLFGTQRYKTGDQSRNNWFTAILTFGEGWHNNHHHYAGSARNGFFWWEYDLNYYMIKLLEFFGIVWKVRGVPGPVKSVQNKETF